MSDEKTITLYRPVGQAELDRIRASGNRGFLPRLTLFHPVLSEGYATQIARDRNTRNAASGNVGYVTRFRVCAAFLRRYPAQTADAK